MADYRAIASVCEAVINLLKSNYLPEKFDNHQLQFEVYTPANFASAMEAGVSLLVYRVYHNSTHRIPPGNPGPNGERRMTKLPLDIHFLLTAWGKDASLQNTIAGWMMRILEDHPILQPGLLNYKWSAFDQNETVELSLAKVSTEDLLRIWDTLIQNKYQLSVPYLARNVRIDSEIIKTTGREVFDREFHFRDRPQTIMEINKRNNA